MLTPKEIQKAADQAMANSWAKDTAQEGTGLAVAGTVVAGAPLPAQLKLVGGATIGVAGIGVGISNEIATFYSTRAQEPPNPAWRSIVVVQVGPLAPPRLTGAVGQKAAALLAKVFRLGPQIAALGLACATSIDRASSAATAGSATWQRRQMFALASFASTMSRDLGVLASTETSLDGVLAPSLKTAVPTASTIPAAIKHIAAHGFPSTVLSSLQRGGATAKQIAQLRAAAVAANAAQLTGRFSTLLTTDQDVVIKLERSTAAELTTYAARVRTDPVYANAS